MGDNENTLNAESIEAEWVSKEQYDAVMSELANVRQQLQEATAEKARVVDVLLESMAVDLCNQSFDAASVSFERFSDLNWDDTAFLNKIGWNIDIDDINTSNSSHDTWIGKKFGYFLKKLITVCHSLYTPPRGMPIG